jgi:hypothetical protein
METYIATAVALWWAGAGNQHTVHLWQIIAATAVVLAVIVTARRTGKVTSHD